MKDRETFYRTIVNSPEWKAWVRENELYPQYDVHESMETGWLSTDHFEAFLKFTATQYVISLLVRFKDVTNVHDERLAHLLLNISV